MADVIPLSVVELQNVLQAKQGLLCLHPIYKVDTRKAAFHEVLLRLLDRRGLEVTPKGFIPTAVQHNLMPQLDMLTLDLLQSQLGLPLKPIPTPVTVNISRHSLLHQPYMDKLADLILRDHPQSMIFELKVGDISRDIAALKNLLGLKSQGTCLCVDYQQGGVRAVELAADLGFDYLKIDAVNISIKYSDVELANVAAACKEARQAGLKIIFERVETPGDFKAIQAYKPDYVQGYLFGQPGLAFAKLPFSLMS